MKVLIIGPGKLGGGIAYKCLQLGVNELYLYGREYEKTEGVSQDLRELNVHYKITSLRNLHDLPEMNYTFFTFSNLKWKSTIDVNDRTIEARDNLNILRRVANEVNSKKLGTIIIISNPVDILTRFCRETFNTQNVFGFGNSLDEMRIMNTISSVKIKTKSNKLICIGEHGGSIVPVLSNIIDVENLHPKLYKEVLSETFNRTQKVIKQCSIPFYAPLFSIEKLIKLILNKQDGILTLSTFLTDTFYDVKDMAIGVPVMLKKGSFDKVVSIDLTDYERELFLNSAQIVSYNYDLLINTDIGV